MRTVRLILFLCAIAQIAACENDPTELVKVTPVSQYTEGTFNIDIVDKARKQPVWEAVGVGRITDNARENLEERVKESVPKFFACYPFVAGSSAPVANCGS